ncbi:MAG: MFS transporter [Planctomycetaceae bacterium]|nr:MFS transporter [Planctomycetaceae bacterium]
MTTTMPARRLAGSARTTARTILADYMSLPALVHMLCFGSFLNRAGSFVMVFLTIYVSEHLNLGPVFATRCIGVFGLGSIVSSLLGGQLADAFGRRRTLLLALFGGATLLVAMSFARTGGQFMGCLFLFALIIEMYRPAAFAMVGDVTTPLQRSHAFGLMYIAVNLGFAIAPPVGGWLASKSFQWLFWGDAVTTAAFGIVVALFIQETLPRRQAQPEERDTPSETAVPSLMPSMEELSAESDLALPTDREDPDFDLPRPEPASPSSGTQITQEPDGFISFGRAALAIGTDGVFLLYCLGNLLTGMVFMQAFSSLPIHLLSLGYSEFEFGSMICVNGILIVALQMPVTHMLNRRNRVAMILLGEVFLAAGFGLTAFAVSRSMFITTIILWTFGEIIQAPIKQAIVTDLAPSSLRARYMGVFSMSHALSLALGPPIGGFVFERFGPRYVWLGGFGVILVAMCLYLVIFNRLNARISLHPSHAA